MMLTSFTILPLFILKALSGGSPNNTGCLCTYGDPCWPTADQFAELELQVSQPLVYPIPTASPCYPIGDPSGNCSEVLLNWTDGNWRSSFPGSMEASLWESYIFKNGTISACYLNTTLGFPCEQGNVPVIGVDARIPEDIQAAVKFALQYNLKLIIKNTGHDFLGRSAKRGAFLVWTHHMKNVTYDPGFVPKGAPKNETYEALTIGAGVQWYEAYAAANDSGRSLVGGLSSGGSVGAAGGWLQGGGHSAALSPSYGLGVDNAIEITVVTSTGEHLTVNNYQYSDLFWALRGGGGGTYGIVTSVTYRTYPSVPIACYVMEANATNPNTMKELVGGILQLQPNLTDAGWGGYGSIYNNGTSLVALGPNMSTEVANATTQPLTDFLLSMQSQGVSASVQMAQFPSFYDWYLSYFEIPAENGGILMFTSRLLSRDTISNRYQNVAEILVDCQALLLMVAGGRVSQFDPDSAGLNPAWRNAVVEVACGVSWEEGATAQEINVKIDQLKALAKTFHDMAPNDGAYFNEASLFEVNWQETFFGSHYSTLKQIKDKYDPYRLFVVAEGVGSEEWNKELTCRW